MLYQDNDGRTLLTRERAELLPSEMRRVRRLTPEQAGVPGSLSLPRSCSGRGAHVAQGPRLPRV